MDPTESLIRNMSRFIVLSSDEENYLRSVTRIVNVKKKQFIVQPEFVCRYKSYIYRGALRSYFIDPSGHDHTIALGVEDYWISDFNSYINQEPATLFVEALEDSILVQIEYHAEEVLIEKYPNFVKFYKMVSERALANYQKRVLSRLSKTAEERYEEFVASNPNIVARVPQYALASYLGISPQHLSKIRNNPLKSS